MWFESPLLLLGLGLIPLLWWLYSAQRRRARRLLEAYANFGGPPESRPAVRSSRRWPTWLMLMLGLSVLTVGMARPHASVEVPRLEGTVILAFDVSGSMAADDLKPTRMAAAKAAAREFVEGQPSGVRIGVIAFSDSGLTVQPPSYERQEILAAIDRLTPQRGTSLGNGILVALDTIESLRAPEGQLYTSLTPEPGESPTPMPVGTFSSASIVLLSDGENTERPDPLLAAEAAAERGVRVYTIGLGTAAGANLTVEGITIRTRLDSEALRQLSEHTGGQYFDAPSKSDLDAIFDQLEPELTVREEPTELTALFAAASTLLLLAGATRSIMQAGRVA